MVLVIRIRFRHDVIRKMYQNVYFLTYLQYKYKPILWNLCNISVKACNCGFEDADEGEMYNPLIKTGTLPILFSKTLTQCFSNFFTSRNPFDKLKKTMQPETIICLSLISHNITLPCKTVWAFYSVEIETSPKNWMTQQ